MVTLPISDDGIKTDGLIGRSVDWVFGYDFFISYSHGDGMRLPRCIKERLEHAGFRIFLDQTEYVAGEDLRRETRRQVVKSRKIVIVARAGALKSEWVKREVDVALDYGKIPVILNVNGAVEAAPHDATLATMARERHWLRLNETLDDPDGEPTDRAISELVRGFHHTRQETKRQRIFATAAVVLALTAGVATWQAFEATMARHTAEAQRDRAQRVLDQVIASATNRVLTLVEHASEDARTQREIAKAIRGEQTSLSVAEADTARLSELVSLASRYSASDASAAAMKAAEAVLSRSDASGEDEQAGSDARVLALSEAHKIAGVAASRLGRTERAIKELARSLSLTRSLAIRSPDNVAVREHLAVALQNMGDISFQIGKLEDADQHFAEALKLRSDAATAAASDPLVEAALHNRIANVRLGQGRSEAALESAKQSVELLERQPVAGTDPDAVQRQLSVAYELIADALTGQDRPTAALDWLVRDLVLVKQLAEHAPQNGVHQHDLAIVYDKIGKVQQRLKHREDALGAYAKAIAIGEQSYQKEQKRPEWLRDTAAVLESHGTLSVELGRPREAIPMLRRALALREQVASSSPGPTLQRELEEAYRRTREILLKSGQVVDALETAEQQLFATALATDDEPGRDMRVAKALGALSWTALFSRNAPRAVWASEQAIAIAPGLTFAQLNYAHALMYAGDIEGARRAYLDGLKPGGELAKDWRRMIRQDFSDFVARDLKHPVMVEIDREIGK
jgi:tetratricopeptide (TPR) repeat protein